VEAMEASVRKEAVQRRRREASPVLEGKTEDIRPVPKEAEPSAIPTR